MLCKHSLHFSQSYDAVKKGQQVYFYLPWNHTVFSFPNSLLCSKLFFILCSTGVDLNKLKLPESPILHLQSMRIATAFYQLFEIS